MIKYLFVLMVFAFSVLVLGTKFEEKTFKPDLTKIVTGHGWKVINLTARLIEEDGRKGVRFDEKKRRRCGLVRRL